MFSFTYFPPSLAPSSIYTLSKTEIEPSYYPDKKSPKKRTQGTKQTVKITAHHCSYQATS